MYNSTEAKKAATILLSANTSLVQAGVCIPMIGVKASWRTQVIGVYDLIDPFLHIDYPNRLEVQQWITTEFSKHQGSGGHLYWGTPNIALPVIYTPKFTIINKMTRKLIPPVTGLMPSKIGMMMDAGLTPEPGVSIPVQMMVRAGSSISAIGYGV